MSDPRVSVIVVSRHRPQHLILCLTGIEQLYYSNFEVIVVADPSGLAAVARAGFGVRAVPFDAPNISAARNLGIAAAGGDIAAFIDDDAVPEPTWLTHLVQPFADASVIAAGGYVRGRNGISFQYRGRRVDGRGVHSDLVLPDDHPVVLDTAPGDAVKTEGTNCAFRLEALRRAGGFDPAFRFYMDETDLNLRLADTGARTAIVPLAQVHHGFAASARRDGARMPLTLHEVAASQVLLLRRHAPEALQSTLDAFRAEQKARLLRHMVAGTCEPRDVARVLDTIETGIADGMKRAMVIPSPIVSAGAFNVFVPRKAYAGMDNIAARRRGSAGVRRIAARKVAEGRRVSLCLLSRTALYHSVRFRPEGFWEQRGGIFGRSERTQPLFRWVKFPRRALEEANRVQSVRKLP